MRCRLHRALAAGLVLPGLLAFAQAQEPAPAPIVRRTARLVEVSVVVQDATGKAVTGLKREDFGLLDEGKRQDITLFVPDARGTQLATDTPQDENTFTNRVERRGAIPTSVSIILLDGLNTRKADQYFARQQVLSFLLTLKPNDRVAVYALGLGLYRLHDFTSDPAALRRAVQAYQGTTGGVLRDSRPASGEQTLGALSGKDAAGKAMIENMMQWLDAVRDREAQYMMTERVRITTAALEAIGRHAAGIPGRKNLIWVSGGFPLSMGYGTAPNTFNVAPSRVSFYSDAERSVRALNDAGLVIYPVEARGVFDSFSENPNLYQSTPRMVTTAQPKGPDAATDDTDRDSLILLAQRTGGRAFYNTNDIAGAVRTAIEDSEGSYLLGYSPDHGAWFGNWRKIKVKVDRPNLRIRHRPGYFAMPEVSAYQADRLAATLSSASSPLEATAIPLTARVAFADAGRALLSVSVQVEYRALQLQRGTGNRFQGTFDVTFAQFDAGGARLRYLTQTVDMNLRSGTMFSMSKEGLEMERVIPLEPRATEVRIAVRDAATGTTGSVSIPLAKIGQAEGPTR